MARILIDGYNLLPVTEHSSRDKLLDALSVFSKERGHEVTVVFDGTHTGRGDGGHEHRGGVEIIFSPITVTADEIIEEMLEIPGAAAYLVVSSDRRIQSAARQTRATFVSSQDFARQLRGRTSATPKDQGQAPPWMEGREEEGDQHSGERRVGKKKKEDRMRQKRLQKL